MVQWRIRGEVLDVELEATYAGSPTYFTIRLHYEGAFTKFPGRKYIKGKMTYVDLVDIDRFSVYDLHSMMKQLGCFEEDKPIFYHFRRPIGDLDFGLFALSSSEDVVHLRKYVKTCKLIDVYTEFWVSKLHTYLMSPKPSNVVLHEIPESMCSKRLFLEWKDDGVCGSSNAPVSGDVDLTPVSGDVDLTPVYRPKMVSPVDEPILGTPNVDEHWNDSFEWCDPFMQKGKQPEVEPLVSDRDDGSEGSDGSNGSEGSDGSEGSYGSEGSDDNEDCDDNADSDFIVDEDNLLDDPDVDMNDFNQSNDKDAEWVGNIPDATNELDASDQELEVIETEVLYSGSSSEEGEGSRKRKKIRDLERAHRNNSAEVKDTFYKWQTFSSPKEVKQAIYIHSIESRRELEIIKNDKNRIRVVCGGTIPNLGILETGRPSPSKPIKTGPSKSAPSKSEASNSGHSQSKSKKKKKVKPDGPRCPWVLLVSKWKKDDDWTVKTYVKEHRCLQTRKIRACTYKFLAKQIIDQLEVNPEIPLRALREQLEKKYSVSMSDMKVHRARAQALESIRGDYASQYTILRDYLQEIQAINPNTTVKLQVENEPHYGTDTRVFKRVYICLGQLKSGFAAMKRGILGLDGCFMKGPYPGIVLTAVGLDGNNCTYPLAYAVVEAECTDSWIWFLTNLGDDIELASNSNFTFISDRQKGVLPAVKKLFPAAEHRYCLRHLHENMKKKWRGKEYRDALWKCATATTVPHLNIAMEELKKLNPATYEWLKEIPAKHWSRAHFSIRPHCDALLNNMCECLNSKLVKGRDKPIITCLEFIREYIMRKLVIVQKTVDKSIGPLTPTATKTLEKIKAEAEHCRVIFCGNGKYQVTGLGLDQYSVNMGEQTCSCNKWELTGMPCKHAMAAIWDMRRNSETVGIPESWVHPTYWLKTWQEMYAFKLEPINGRFMWEKSLCPTKLVAPKHHVPIGRPKKRRRRSATEDDAGKTVKCRKCGNFGHNGRSCKGQGKSVGGHVVSTSGGNGRGAGTRGGGVGRCGGTRGGGLSRGVGNGIGAGTRGGGVGRGGGTRGGGGVSRGGGNGRGAGTRGGGVGRGNGRGGGLNRGGGLSRGVGLNRGGGRSRGVGGGTFSKCVLRSGIGLNKIVGGKGDGKTPIV